MTQTFIQLSSMMLVRMTLRNENNDPQIDHLDSLLLVEESYEERTLSLRLLACETKVIPGEFGFIAWNEGMHLKKRPTKFHVDGVLQPFNENKFNFTKVCQVPRRVISNLF
ncbi:hypothetical protein CASFOL_014148 [Castilleja foliolosa]|uniref:GDPGP1-like N-terminal domain-containing protein n=1 Tax=Castilleja foliolosa TaxID=1961234 RepID=A0ABD3DM19_9LAMI